MKRGKRANFGRSVLSDGDPEDRDPVGPDPRAFTIDDLALEQGAKFQYTYDFGDDWQRVRCRLPGSPLPGAGPGCGATPAATRWTVHSPSCTLGGGDWNSYRISGIGPTLDRLVGALALGCGIFG